MPTKSNIKKLNIYQIILGISIGIGFFTIWIFGLDFIKEKFSLPNGHPLLATLFIFLPSFFGFFAFLISKGTYFQRVTYLFLGVAAFSIAFLTWGFIELVKDPKPYYLTEGIGTIAGICTIAAVYFFLGGVFVLILEVTLKGLKKIKNKITGIH